jgi:hypothetical protein
MTLDGNPTVTTGWGSLTLDIDRSTTLQYLNFSINGSWQIQNVPVTAIPGFGDEALTFDFLLSGGTPVTSATFGFTLTDGLSAQPVENSFTPIGFDDLIFDSGKGGATASVGTPAPLIGGAVVDSGKVSGNFPNQDVGKGECGPGAVSNSLQYLNARWALGLKDGDISIDTMKTATGWKPDTLNSIGWENTKNAYMKKNGLPITTTSTFDPKEVIKALNAGQDVEIDGKVHIAAVVAMKDLGGGKYQVDVAHDTKQGEAGGTEIQSGTYDSTTGLFKNIKWLDGKGTDHGFIIECPTPEPGTIWLTVFGFAAVVLRAAKRPKADDRNGA